MSMITILFRGEREISTDVDVHLQAEKGRDLAKLVRQAKQLREDHKTAREQEKSEMTALANEIDDLAKIVAEGKEMRLVTVEERGDHETGRVHVYRTDTGQKLYERAMTPEEGQTRIEMVGKPTDLVESSPPATDPAPKPCESCGILPGIDGPEDQRVTLPEACEKCGATAGWRVIEPGPKPEPDAS